MISLSIPLKRYIDSMASLVNIKVLEHSSFVRRQARESGAQGTAEVMAYYVRNLDNLSVDPELKSFIDFLALNWKSSSSQWCQDIFVMHLTNCRRSGSYLEIGGADGFTHSNTYSLECKFGWQGSLVEPDPDQFSILKKVRSARNSLFRNAIAPDGAKSTIRLRKAGQLSSLEGYEGEDMHSAVRMRSRSFARVQAISLASILLAKNYDYFSLDIEGAELKILQGLDWDIINKPSIITVECNFRRADGEAIEELLKNNGYKIYFPDHEWLRRGDIWAALI